MRTFQSLSFAMVVVITSACSSSDLTRSSAEEIIKKENEYPMEITKTFSVGSNLRLGAAYREYREHFVPELNQSGLAEATYNDNYGPAEASIKLTQDANKYIKSNGNVETGLDFITRRPYTAQKITVLTYTCDLDEVTGVAFLNEEKSMAKVEYTQVCESTPFGKLSIFSNASLEVPMKKEITLQLYDDGWRKFKLF